MTASYDYSIVKGEDSKVVTAVVEYLNSSHLRMDTAVELLNALSMWGEQFEILYSSSEIRTYSNEDFKEAPSKESRESLIYIIKDRCPKEYLIRVLDLAYSALNPVEYVISNGDAVKRHLTPSESDIQFCKERIAEAMELIK